MAGPKKSRKSPVEHKVGTHTRRGKVVDEFKRGSGKHPDKPKRSRAKKVVGRRGLPLGGRGDYRVRLHYVQSGNENFKLEAESFQEAQKSGFRRSDNVFEPIKVTIRRI